MDVSTFLITVYCIVDDYLKVLLKGKRLRQRGPQPIMCDSEVLTIEIVGEFFGIDTEKGLFQHFREYYSEWFPAICQIHRTTFTRQCANLWRIKAKLWKYALSQIRYDPMISILDSCPIPICRPARAYRSRQLREHVAFSYDEVAGRHFLGLRAHLRVCWPGVIVDTRLTAANVHELTAADDMLSNVQGWMLADRNYWSPNRAELARLQGLYWIAPYRFASKEPFQLPARLKHVRYRIETVFGQLVERFNAKRVWAKDAWHLTSRWLRKILSHTFAVLFCQSLGLPPLHFSQLITF